MSKGKKNPKGFTDVEFPSVYPQESVPENVVLMDFNNDSDALLFREWWLDEGSVAFAKYRREQPDD